MRHYEKIRAKSHRQEDLNLINIWVTVTSIIVSLVSIVFTVLPK